ncbi:MAG: family 10 glycosylhydrolase [Phycisphaerae bacterium]|nr:family 10 glycosylhydrolase [Phycisphaerae bacterium]
MFNSWTGDWGRHRWHRISIGLVALVFAVPGLGQTVTLDNNNANNTDGVFTVLSGGWTLTDAGTTDKWEEDYLFAGAGGTLSEVEWRPDLPTAGLYDVYIFYRPGSNRAPDAPYTVHHAGGATTIDVDQRINGAAWDFLGQFSFTAGTAGTVSLSDDATSGNIIADAVRFVWVDDEPPPADPAFRGFWADVFGVGFKSQAEIDTMIARALTGRYNAIVAEVLAYQDTSGGGHGAYWHSSIVPWAAEVNVGFDPLAYLCQQAHAAGLEVHAWLVTYRVSMSWPPAGNTTIAAHPEWIMVPQAAMGGGPVTIEGKYVLDPGSPDVQEYLVSIVRELVSNYPIDGINFDYIRYTQTDAGYPADAGYTRSSLARFKQITGYVGTPSSTNSAWSDFRRRTIDELVRRCRAEIPAITTNPRQPLRLTADLYAAGNAPADFTNSSAYALFQNWKYWLERGWLDAGMPMNYKDERNATHAQWFRNWIDAAVSYRAARHVYCGQGNYLNSKANSIIQLQYIYNAGANGSVNYSYRSTADEDDDGNPEADWTWYPYVAANFFTAPALTPTMPWRDPALATEGTLWGRVTDIATGEAVDDATVMVSVLPPVKTDGNGYYVVTLVPATAGGTGYTAMAGKAGYDAVVHAVTILPGDVVRRDFQFGYVPGDLDFDGDVDLADFGVFSTCFNGPNRPPVYPSCGYADLDDDDDVDLADFGIFSTCFNGPNRPPACL